MRNSPFIGTWKLSSFELRNSDGQVVYPVGKDAVGYLIYNEDGYMSVAIMAANRPKFASGDIRAGSVEEKAAAADSYLSYSGRYEIQGDKIIHHLEVCSFPNWTGTAQERFIELDEDRLSLNTPPYPVAGIQQTGHLIWERV